MGFSLGLSEKDASMTFDVHVHIRMWIPVGSTGCNIHYLFYKPILCRMLMMDTTDAIKQLNVEIVLYGKYKLHKHKVHSAKNTKRTLLYMENPEPEYTWYEYDTGEYLPTVTKNKFYYLTKI